MKRHLDDRRFRIFGVPFKPVLLWGAISMAIMAQANFRNADRGLQYPLSTIVAVISLSGLVLVVASAIAKSTVLVQVALLGIFLAFTTRTVFVWMQTPFEQAGWYGIAAMALAGGAYFVERADDMTGRDGE